MVGVTDDDQERRNIRDWLRALPPAGALYVTGQEYASTVRALRDYIVHEEPSLKDDIDRYIEQLNEQPMRYLRAIASDPVDTCRELKITTGRIKLATLESLAKGEISDRHRAEDKRFSMKQLVASAVLAAFLTWLVTFLAIGAGG